MKHQSKLVLSLLLVLTTGYQSEAQLSESFTIEQAKAYAIEHQVDIKNAINDVEIARQQMIETRGIGLPQIDFSGQFSQYLEIPVNVVDASVFNPMAPPGELMEFRMGTEFASSGTLDVNQLVFNGSYIVGLQVSKYFQEFQVTASEVTKEDVVFNVINAYQLATIAKGNVAFADSMVQLTSTLVEKQKNFLDLGFILQEDMDQLNYSLLSAQNAYVSAEVQYNNAINLLKLYMGYPISDEIVLEDDIDDLLSKQSISTGDVHSNLQYKMMQQKVELSAYNVKNNKMTNLPSLYAFFRYGVNAYENDFNFFKDNTWYEQSLWGLQLNVPIFSGLQRNAKLKQSKIELLKDANNLQLLEESLKFQEKQASNNLRGAETKYALQKENIKLAETIYRNAVTKEKIGKGNSLDVTQKHNQLMMAQSQYLGSMIELFQARLALDKLYNEILSNQ